MLDVLAHPLVEPSWLAAHLADGDGVVGSLTNERCKEERSCSCESRISITTTFPDGSTDSMSISSSARKRKRVAASVSEELAVAPPITLSERSSTGLALLRIFVGYLWFQQLFWKMPLTFAGLYGYVVRESQHAILPGYGALLQHTFLAGCSSLSSPIGCTAFVPLAACVWTAELLVAISLLFGLFTRFGAMLATVLSVQLYVGLAYTEWIWTYGMLVLLALAFVAVPAGRRLGIDLWLAPRLQEAGQRHSLARIASWFV
jgi:hypothetical protein